MTIKFDLDLAPDADLYTSVLRAVDHVLSRNLRPSAVDLLSDLEEMCGPKLRWWLPAVISDMADDAARPHDQRAYLRSLLRTGDLDRALAGNAPAANVDTGASIDELIRFGLAYRGSKAFKEMIEFMGRFRDYAPYNVMLVKLQNPACGFFATARDWERRFGRTLREDARPMLILAPMHPVMLVYDLDQTDGPPLPQELANFGRVEGVWKDAWLNRLVENAARHDGITIDVKALSTTLAGFAQVSRGQGKTNFRIALHKELDAPGRFGVLCHELAHIFLGHLGGHPARWWPSRQGLDHATVELEAEAVAYVVTRQLGLTGGSPAYVSRFLRGPDLPQTVSIHLIAKVASRIKEMATGTLSERTMPSKAKGPRR